MRAYERFLEYLTIWTSSKRDAAEIPSSLHQFDLAHQLAFELRQLGLCDVEVDNHCFVYGKLAATAGYENCPKLGLIAHLDTHPDCPGKDVKAQVIHDYYGGDIPLAKSGLSLTVAQFPHLPQLTGQTLITSSGDTLLGADDKAGIAEILTALEQVLQSDRPHGQVSVSFIPDEEIGIGTTHFNLPRFDAQFAYTVDGWDVGEIVAETFNACQATIHFHGISVHTGRARGRMINAQLVALEFASLLPEKETPGHTDGHEGFFHLLRSGGTVQEAELIYNLRDFTHDGMMRRKELLEKAAKQLNQRYGDHTVSIQYVEQYRNMKDILDECPHLLEKAAAACRSAGVVPIFRSTRGGTDGARLTFAGLPCPNLGLGGFAYHSPYEHITAEAMDQVSDILQELIYQFA